MSCLVQAYKDILNYYFSYAEEARDWRPCSVDIDSFFVAGNLVLQRFETFDPRYRLHVERCVAAWTGQQVRLVCEHSNCNTGNAACRCAHVRLCL